jgi:hypothetical protein
VLELPGSSQAWRRHGPQSTAPLSCEPHSTMARLRHGPGAGQSPARRAVLPRSPEPTVEAQPQCAAPGGAAEQSCAAPPKQPLLRLRPGVAVERVAMEQAWPQLAAEQELRREQQGADLRPRRRPLLCDVTTRARRRRAWRPATNRFSVFAHCLRNETASRKLHGFPAADTRERAQPHRSRANSNGSSFRLRQLPSECPGFHGS